MPEQLAALAKLSRIAEQDESLTPGDPSRVPGFCLPCGKDVSFVIDNRGRESATGQPNWRETLVCPGCSLSNRQRVMAALAQRADRIDGRSYFMEQTTPLYRWAKREMTNVTGSEYFGPDFSPGAKITPLQYRLPTRSQSAKSLFHALKLAARMLIEGGLRHENVERLSFADASMNLIISNDVFEHVAEPCAAFAECARILKPGGELIATFPIDFAAPVSCVRATLKGGVLEHLLPAHYHGNPISDAGSLVFTDFGCDVKDQLLAAGFADVRFELYRDTRLGHLGPGVTVVRARLAQA